MHPHDDYDFAHQALRRLRLRHIELLHALDEVATASAAAARLNLSQPAISKMLQEIESVSRTQLFHRGRRGIEPTDAGRLLIRHATLAVHQFDVAGQQLQAMRLGASALLNIGASSTLPLLSQAIAALRRQQPSLLIRVFVEPPRQLISKLMVGDIDCALAPLPPDALSSPEAERMQLRPVMRDRMCVVTSPRHRLARRKKLQWSELMSEQWVLSPPEGLTRQQLVATCLRQHLAPPRPVIECVSFASVRWLLHNDPQLVALTRMHQVIDDVSIGLIALLPVTPMVDLPDVSLITRRGPSADPEALTALLAALRAASRQPADGD